MSPASESVRLQRSLRLANEAIHAVALQCRRLRSSEPEDDTFVMRRWADFQFLIVALRRLHRAVEIATHSTTVGAEVRAALVAFDAAVPSLKAMRNVGEHIGAYARDSPHRHDKSIDRRQLEVGSFDDRTLRWLRTRDGSDHELDADAALAAAEHLYARLRRAASSRTA